MIVQYLLQAPGRYITLKEEELYVPFKITPVKDHAFLKLGDYFDSIRAFVLEENLDNLLSILRHSFHSPISTSNIEKVLIKSEKHGSFHHVAGIDLVTRFGTVRFALATYLFANKLWFEREYRNLKYLGSKTEPLHLLPRVYLFGEQVVAHGDKTETFFFLLMEWLEGFHEWHLTPSCFTISKSIVIWDQVSGHRLATDIEALEIFRKIAFILATCYDTKSFHRINLWQNAAGDFVTRSEKGRIKVMLTTVRDYSPVLRPETEPRPQPLMALTFFFLELITLIRLDRQDGTGNLLWCGEWCLYPAIRGFFEGLQAKVERQEEYVDMHLEFLDLLKSFQLEELLGLLEYTILSLEYLDPDTQDFLVSKKQEHAEALFRVIQKFLL